MLFYNEKIFNSCFSYSKRYWYKNIKYIPLYFRRIHHLIKYGYDKCAFWQIDDWFIQTIKPILVDYREKHYSVPIVIDNYPYIACTEEDKIMQKDNEEKWDGIINRMIELLDDMDETSPKYDVDEYEHNWEKQNKEINAAKDEFFGLFSKYFYDLWD